MISMQNTWKTLSKTKYLIVGNIKNQRNLIAWATKHNENQGFLRTGFLKHNENQRFLRPGLLKHNENQWFMRPGPPLPSPP